MIMSFQCANIQKIFLTFAAEMKKNVKQVAIIGGGAAGFFCAVCLKEALPEAEVTIFERSTKVLGKVEISGYSPLRLKVVCVAGCTLPVKCLV